MTGTIRFTRDFGESEREEVVIDAYSDLPTVLEGFTRFLRVMGYHIHDDEVVDIVPRDDGPPFDMTDAEE